MKKKSCKEYNVSQSENVNYSPPPPLALSAYYIVNMYVVKIIYLVTEKRFHSN